MVSLILQAYNMIRLHWMSQFHASCVFSIEVFNLALVEVWLVLQCHGNSLFYIFKWENSTLTSNCVCSNVADLSHKFICLFKCPYIGLGFIKTILDCTRYLLCRRVLWMDKVQKCATLDTWVRGVWKEP